MKFTHEKDLKYNGIGFNAIWIRKHNESDFVAKCIVLFPKLNEKQAKELYKLIDELSSYGRKCIIRCSERATDSVRIIKITDKQDKETDEFNLLNLIYKTYN